MSVRSEKKARYRQIRQDFGIGIDGDDGNGTGDGRDVGLFDMWRVMLFMALTFEK